jgi:hypothetical protein
VILPDHQYAIWALPERRRILPCAKRLIKAAFSRGSTRGERISASCAGKGERGIWQRRYWQHTLRDASDFVRHLDYIHLSPVKHGYATRAQDWPYSSVRRWARLGADPASGAGDTAEEIRKFWGGPAKLTDTIEQLLGYLSWRDSETAILVFNRNRNFSNVLAAIPQTVMTHPNFRLDDGKRGETGFRYRFRHKDDPAKLLHLTVLAFDVPRPEDSA